MKKWFFISAIFLVIAYFVQIFYIGKLNQEFFNNLAKENEIYKIDNLNFNKGFFKSSASFDLILKDERYNSFNIKDKVIFTYQNQDIAIYEVNNECLKPYIILK